mmetsp:Transcript_11740/g.28473  ORF Transcript_11740/g.28473 Transcript_11740/m.28473 type:complete len:1484 (-) Transcript_11740:134-4585(-)
MDLLKSMMEAAEDTREELHAPHPVLSATNQVLLDRLAQPPSPTGEKEMGYLRYPHMRGDKVVFVSEGNIWVASQHGGPAARVSASYSAEALPKLSGDGSRVAFLAQSGDGYEVFVLPIAGGLAKRVSYGSQAVKLEGWTKDGNLLIVTTLFSPIGLPQLAILNVTSNVVSVLPFDRATGGSQDEHGCYVFYPLRQTSSTKRYQGGEQSRLWRWCHGDQEAKILTPESWSKRGAWNPMTTPAFPNTIFFLSDHSGVVNLWSMGSGGGAKTQITHECGMDIMEASIDKTTVVYRQGGSIHRLALGGDGVAAGAAAVLPITLISEFRDASPQTLQFPMEEMQEIALSEDGLSAVILVRGQIFFTPLVAQLGQRIEKVTTYDGAVRYRHVQFVRSEHPEDNLKIIAMSDATGEYEYVMLERGGGEGMGGFWNETALTSGSKIRGVMSYSSISPDASSLVFDDTYGRISVLNLSTTAVNTFAFKTEPDEAEKDDGGAGGDYHSKQGGAGGGAPGIQGGAQGGASSAASATQGGADTRPGADTNSTSPFPGGAARRERSTLRRKRRELRRDTRSQFRRDWQLTSLLNNAPGAAPPSAASPPPRAAQRVASAGAARRARNMHHTRFGGAPLQGGFSDLFGAHLGATGPLSGSRAREAQAGQASLRTVMGGLRPEAAGDYSWSPDGRWLAFSASDATEFSCVHVWSADTGDVRRLTHPSYNAVEPKFSPDGLFLYYFSDQQISSGADSPYGMRGSEPTIVGAQQLMCLPLRDGFKCPFFMGDELNAMGKTYGPSIGKQFKTKVSVQNVEKRAVPVPFLEKRQYFGLHIVGDGHTFLMQMWDGEGLYLISLDIVSGAVVPIYPDPRGVFVSGDGQVIMLAVEQGLALLSAKALGVPGVTQDQVLASAILWSAPAGWTVTVNPRAEWMQMYNDAMRNMRDAFYDPGMHGLDWSAITEMYRPLVYRISTKSELRDVLQQALGELSVLHVFVSIRSEAPVLPSGEPTSCFGGDLVTDPRGLRVVRVFDTSGILMVPNSPLAAAAVDLRPGDIITRVDGYQLNTSDRPVSRALLGKAGMQVLVEVDLTPRDPPDEDDDEIRAAAEGGGGFSGMGGATGGEAGGAGAGASARQSAYVADRHARGVEYGHGSGRGHNGAGVGTRVHTVAHIAHAKRQRVGGSGGLGLAPRILNSGGRKGLGVGELGGGGAGANVSDTSAHTSKKVGGITSVVVTPMSHYECSELRVADALNARRSHVQIRSGNALAYVYLEDMEQMGEGSSNSFDDFAAQFYPAIRKAGLIIDVRRNAGGNIDTWILERLRRVAWMFNTARAGPGDTTMQYAFQGKVAVLVDEMTSSDAEIFAAGIQQLKLGKVIGMRSWGGAVGYSSNPELQLVDGSGFTIPSFGPYVGSKWMIEQQGVIPDIVVENLPVSTFHGNDKQLDVAVDHLMALIRSNPNDGKIPAKPAYPDWSFDRETCSGGASPAAAHAAHAGMRRGEA